MNKEKHDKKYTRGEKISLALFGICFGLYFLNILVGKASIVYGWKLFYLGNIGEFFLLFTASIFFIVAALHRETVYAADRETNK